MVGHMSASLPPDASLTGAWTVVIPTSDRCAALPLAPSVALSPQFFQQRPRFLQVGGVKALREPVVDRRE
jgi:hypothetical protein